MTGTDDRQGAGRWALRTSRAGGPAARRSTCPRSGDGDGQHRPGGHLLARAGRSRARPGRRGAAVAERTPVVGLGGRLDGAGGGDLGVLRAGRSTPRPQADAGSRRLSRRGPTGATVGVGPGRSDRPHPVAAVALGPFAGSRAAADHAGVAGRDHAVAAASARPVLARRPTAASPTPLLAADHRDPGAGRHALRAVPVRRHPSPPCRLPLAATERASRCGAPDRRRGDVACTGAARPMTPSYDPPRSLVP
jgi:hypothetical protein